jgi:hypothetical protein
MSDDTDDSISPSVHLGQSQLQLNDPFTITDVSAIKLSRAVTSGTVSKTASSLLDTYFHQDNVVSMENFA